MIGPPCAHPHSGQAAVGMEEEEEVRPGFPSRPALRCLLHQLWYFQSLRGEGRSTGGSKEKQRNIRGCRELGGPTGGIQALR